MLWIVSGMESERQMGVDTVFSGHRVGCGRDRLGVVSRGMRARIGLAVCVACVGVISGVVCAGAQAAVSCANEALRQELGSGALPDCRAYELVSPPYKEGSQLVTHNLAGQRGAVAEDGDHVIGFGYGAFAESKSEPFESIMYELSRSASGWTATSLAPPGSLSPESNFFGASRDLSKTLWGLDSATGSVREENLFVREPDGAFVEIGPLVSPAYAGGPPSGTTTKFGKFGLVNPEYTKGGGASADLSHVLFGFHGTAGQPIPGLWPGDKTLSTNEISEHADSLYEYVGTGNTRPMLVGVDSEGRQISQCGVDLGVGPDVETGERYNAVSANGETVFFTAKPGGCKGTIGGTGEEVTGAGPPVQDLYARLGSRETVNISEPASNICETCRTGHSPTTTVEKPAFFAGASEDGSKVFFTTEQELLAGRTTNNLYEFDFNNSNQFKVLPVALGSSAPEVESVLRISEDGSHAYFVAKGVLTSEPRGGVGGSCYQELTPAELAEEETGKKEGKCRPKAGANNLYVFVRNSAHPFGEVEFIASLANEVTQDQATPDGRYLVFTSTQDLTSDDTSTPRQLFEYDAQEELLVRVSKGQCVPASLSTCTSPERFNDNGNTSAFAAEIGIQAYDQFDSPSAGESGLSVSNDGAYVVFASTNDLTPGAEAASSSGAASVYEYRSAGSIATGDVYLVSNGTDTTTQGVGSGSGKGDVLWGEDASGEDVFFSAGASLLGVDTNEDPDLYDARIGGGFPEPAIPSECVGEGCLGVGARASVLGSPGSVSAVAGGNLKLAATAPPVALRAAANKPSGGKCPRGKKRVRGRCIKTKKLGGKKTAARSKKATGGAGR